MLASGKCELAATSSRSGLIFTNIFSVARSGVYCVAITFSQVPCNPGDCPVGLGQRLLVGTDLLDACLLQFALNESDQLV